MNQAQRKFIDESSYETLLRRWRFAEAGDDIFKGEIGKYYQKVMNAQRDANEAEAVAASKRVGWEKGY